MTISPRMTRPGDLFAYPGEPSEREAYIVLATYDIYAYDDEKLCMSTTLVLTAHRTMLSRDAGLRMILHRTATMNDVTERVSIW